MVTMKRKERRESAKENGRREKKRGEAGFHPSLAPLQCTYYTAVSPSSSPGPSFLCVQAGLCPRVCTLWVQTQAVCHGPV